ncbi:MAG: UDP-3-O-(3-hydroxymyristoyl) N-acetylglucosamine deacetylase [Deltaproteobacteria bacterium]|nr:UDP-3-O-(3-hydroxymyristoyl) N-acetylglucosamine deacetylase [Deltaproteobacteria bacterium]
MKNGGAVKELSSQKTILVVDDEDKVRESVKEVLTDEGYRVLDTADATCVLEMIEAEQPGLVLLDIWMPKIDGIGLLKEIKSKKPSTNVVMISGHGNIHTAVTATKFGAFDFIEKPVSLDGLLHTVQRALGELPVPQSLSEIGQRHGAEDTDTVSTALRIVTSAESIRQKTLRKSVVSSGQGLHSGIKTGLILHPLPPNSGILFEGISGDVSVPAHLDYVGSTGFATSLSHRGFTVATVEHFLAVLHSYGITNLLVKVQGEVPILDGSAAEFCELIEEAGLHEQDESWSRIVIDRPYRIGDDGGEWISIEPAETFSVHYVLKYPKPVGVQEYIFTHQSPTSFKEEIAPARTFGFLRDMEKMQKLGLINGGKLSNCILIDDEKIVNTDLRFPEELARHKILDIIGDFYLLGRPIRGKITAHMTGHSDNIALLKAVRTGLGL